MRLAHKSLFIAIMLGSIIISAYSINKLSQQTKPEELDKIIREASTYLNENISHDSKVVILNIEATSNAVSDYIIDELVANAVNDKIFTVVDRNQINDNRAEQQFQTSGDVADDQAVAIGKWFGAQIIISGKVSN